MPLPEWFRFLSVAAIIPAGALGGFAADAFKGFGRELSAKYRELAGNLNGIDGIRSFSDALNLQDYSAILRLQSANFVANLSEEERKEGFLSAEFSLEQVAEMAEDLGTTIATVDGDVVAFLCAFRNEFNHGSPVIAKMLDTYAVIKFDGKPLSSYNSYIYGPVCIDRDYRRRGLLRGLL